MRLGLGAKITKASKDSFVATGVPVIDKPLLLSPNFHGVFDAAATTGDTWTQRPNSFSYEAFINDVSVGWPYVGLPSDAGKKFNIEKTAHNAFGPSLPARTPDFIIPIEASAFANLKAWIRADNYKEISPVLSGVQSNFDDVYYQVNGFSSKLPSGPNAVIPSAGYEPKSQRLIDFYGGRNLAGFSASSLSLGSPTVGNTDLFADNTTNFTVWWVGRPTGAGYLFSKGATNASNVTFSLYSTGTFASIRCRGSQSSLGAHAAGDLIIIGAKWDGTALKTFFNSTIATATVGSATESINNNHLQNIIIGALSNTNATGMVGAFAELAIFDVAQSDADFAAFGNMLTDYYKRAPSVRFVISGPSNENYSFEEQNGKVKTAARLAKYYGLHAEIVTSVQNGATLSAVASKLKTTLDGLPARSYPTKVFIGNAMGNDVTETRPFSNVTPTQKTNWTNALLAMISDITTRGHTCILGEINFRHYSGTVTESNQQAGALPYNTDIIYPLISPEHRYSDGSSIVEMYRSVMANQAEWLVSDGIHERRFAGQHAHQDEWAYKVGGLEVNGVAPAQRYF